MRRGARSDQTGAPTGAGEREKARDLQVGAGFRVLAEVAAAIALGGAASAEPGPEPGWRDATVIGLRAVIEF